MKAVPKQNRTVAAKLGINSPAYISGLAWLISLDMIYSEWQCIIPNKIRYLAQLISE
jgi:hypothetical protein